MHRTFGMIKTYIVSLTIYQDPEINFLQEFKEYDIELTVPDTYGEHSRQIAGMEVSNYYRSDFLHKFIAKVEFESSGDIFNFECTAIENGILLCEMEIPQRAV